MAERGRFLWPVVSISPDGEWVAVSKLFDDQIRILDTTDGHELASLSAQVPVSSVAAGPQRLLAIAGGGSIRLWRHEIRQENGKDIWNSTALPTIGTHLGTIRQIRFAGDRNMIAASGRTSGIELWDVDSGEAVATLATSGQADNLAFSRHGELLLASMEDTRYGGLRAWAIDEPIAKNLVGNAPEPVVALGLQAGSDMRTLFAQTLSGQVWYDILGDGPMRQLRLADGTDRFSAVRTDQQGRLWTLLTDRSIQRWDQWRPDAPHLTRPSASFQLPEMADGAWAMRGFGLTRMPTGLVFAQNSGRTFTSRGSMLYLMDPTTGKEFTPIQLEADSHHPDRQAGQEKSDRRRFPPGGDRDRGERERGGQALSRPGNNPAGLGMFRNAMPFSRRLSVSPNGDRMAMLRGDSWEFWDLRDQLDNPAGGRIWSADKRPIPPVAPKSGLTAMAMSPDGALLALATREGLVTLVNVERWSVVSQFQAYSSELAGANPISDLSFMPGDRPMLAVASQSQIALWCLEGEPARFLNLPVDSPSATPMIWDHNGQGLYLVEEEKRVIRWDLARIFQKIEALGLLKK
jgi:WD40 repeat protein